MDIEKTFAFFSDHDQDHPQLIDTINIKGQWWLVGTWLQGNSTRQRIPETLVLLDNLKHQEVNESTHRFVLNNSIPISVLDGAPQEGYVVATYQVLAHGPVSGAIQH